MAALDVAIVGGGPVGSALAALLAPRGLAVEVFEARPARTQDRRTLALSHATQEMLRDVGAWPEGATPIRSIHVSQRGAPGRTVMDAADVGLPALGATVPYAALEQALHAALARHGVALRLEHACTGIALAPDRATLAFANGREAQARLLVLADGGANAGRIPGIAFSEKDYGQSAVVARVSADRAHDARAYERFTTAGPMALLPVDDRYALVWTAAPAEAARLLALDDGAFLAELQAAFGDRAGRFTTVANRGAFPLKLRTVNTPIALRTAIIGNAAQALHPIAGQGLNLGLRDAAQLAEIVATTKPEDLGAAAMLARYRDARRRDAGRGVAFTDLLVSVFGSRSRVVALGRGAALAALDVLPPARRWLAQRMIHGARA